MPRKREKVRSAQVAQYETLLSIHPAEVFAHAPVGIAVSDARGRLVEANRCLADLLGYDTGELVGRDLLGLVHGDDTAEVRTHLNRMLAASAPGDLRLEPRLVRRDGAVLWVLLAVSLVRDQAGDAGWLVITAQDVTDRYRRQLQLLHQAYHDPLTGLPNRAAFAERIHRQLFRAPVPESLAALCFVDLDGFKAVNDRLGHHVGDRLLAAVAGRIQGKVAPQGHLLARLGGDEFVILIGHQARPGTAIQVAGEVLRALEQPFTVGAHRLRISASIGVVEKPAAATSPTELLWAADLTMRRAKAGGKGRWTLYDADTDDRAYTSYLNRS
jgi:diguanylate cyclase (GGDEF)-like protein/PAS domain S-box-containing protein